MVNIDVDTVRQKIRTCACIRVPERVRVGDDGSLAISSNECVSFDCNILTPRSCPIKMPTGFGSDDAKTQNHCLRGHESDGFIARRDGLVDWLDSPRLKGDNGWACSRHCPSMGLKERAMQSNMLGQTGQGVRNLRIGVDRKYALKGIDSDQAAAIEEALKVACEPWRAYRRRVNAGSYEAR